MSAPDRIFANPYYGMSQHKTSGIWTLGNITGHGTEYILLDPNARVVTVDQLDRFRSVSLSGLVSREIGEIIGEVK